MIQLSDTVWVDPDHVIGVVPNRSESAHLRQTRLYLLDNRTVTVDRPVLDVVGMIAPRLIPLDADGLSFLDPAHIVGIVENRRASGYARPARLYIRGGRTITVSGSLQAVVEAVQAAQYGAPQDA